MNKIFSKEDKIRCFPICTVLCLHAQGEVRHLCTVGIHFWLIWC